MLKVSLLCLAVAICHAGPVPSQTGTPSFNLVQEILTGTTTTKKPSSIIDEYLRVNVPPRDGFDVRPTPAPAIPVSSGSANAAINCRDFVYAAATTPTACLAVRQADFVAGPSADRTTGYCRWDPQASACWCPRPKDNCDNVKQCYWNRDPSLTGNFAALLSSAVSGECISNAERFYNVLSNLLLKRGKQDFAIRINYSSAPARGQLPLGPYGPAIIGAGSAIQGMLPPSMPTQGYGDPFAGYGLPNQVMLGLPPFSLPQSSSGFGSIPQFGGFPPLGGFPQFGGFPPLGGFPQFGGFPLGGR